MAGGTGESNGEKGALEALAFRALKAAKPVPTSLRREMRVFKGLAHAADRISMRIAGRPPRATCKTPAARADVTFDREVAVAETRHQKSHGRLWFPSQLASRIFCKRLKFLRSCLARELIHRDCAILSGACHVTPPRTVRRGHRGKAKRRLRLRRADRAPSRASPRPFASRKPPAIESPAEADFGEAPLERSIRDEPQRRRA